MATMQYPIIGQVSNGCDIYEVPKWVISCLSDGPEGRCHFESGAQTKADARHIARMHQKARHKLAPDDPEFEKDPELAFYR